jgi:hypothetical protein
VWASRFRYAGANSTPDSPTALSRLGAVTIASSRSPSRCWTAASCRGTPHRRTAHRRTPRARHRRPVIRPPAPCRSSRRYTNRAGLASESLRQRQIRDRSPVVGALTTVEVLVHTGTHEPVEAFDRRGQLVCREPAFGASSANVSACTITPDSSPSRGIRCPGCSPAKIYR